MPRRKRAAHACPAQTNFAAGLFADGVAAPETTAGAATLRETVGLLPFADYAPVYAIKLVRTGALALKEGPVITSPRHAANLLGEHLAGADREIFVILMLDTKNRVIGINTVSIGDLSSALVHPREVFKAAILANAATVLLAHNHPSGNPTPSSEDIAVTKRLGEAGELLGISVVDHVVLGEKGQWVSLRERGLYYGDLTPFTSKLAQTHSVLTTPAPD